MVNIDYGARPNSRIMAMTAADRREIEEEREKARRKAIAANQPRCKRQEYEVSNVVKVKEAIDHTGHVKMISVNGEEPLVFKKTCEKYKIPTDSLYKRVQGVRSLTITILGTEYPKELNMVITHVSSKYVGTHKDGKRVDGSLEEVAKLIGYSASYTSLTCKSEATTKNGWKVKKEEITWED